MLPWWWSMCFLRNTWFLYWRSVCFFRLLLQLFLFCNWLFINFSCFSIRYSLNFLTNTILFCPFWCQISVTFHTWYTIRTFRNAPCWNIICFVSLRDVCAPWIWFCCWGCRCCCSTICRLWWFTLFIESSVIIWFLCA